MLVSYCISIGESLLFLIKNILNSIFVFLKEVFYGRESINNIYYGRTGSFFWNSLVTILYIVKNILLFLVISCFLYFLTLKLWSLIKYLYGSFSRKSSKKTLKPIGVLYKSPFYKPFRYPWAIENWSRQQSLFWLVEEIPLDLDRKDFFHLSEHEKHVIVQILRFFTQTDIEVASLYLDYYLPYFKATEIRMMLTSFANMETIHIHAYQMLITTLGLPDVEFSIFMNYEAMKAKYDYMQYFTTGTPEDIAINLAIVSGLLEGAVLFGSFVILLHFSKNRPNGNVMNGVGNVVAFSMRDETLHCLSIIQLYHVYVQEQLAIENSTFDLKKVHKVFIENLHIIMENEIRFVNLCFEGGDLPGLKAEDVIKYIKFIFNRRCEQLGVELQFPEINENPLSWVEEAIGMSVTNFFNGTPSDYAKSSTVENWDDIFAK
jgi:ribonucleoside-diphosphate reductase beta chain